MNIPPELVVISLILIGLIYYNSRKKVRSFKIYKHHIKGYKAVKVGIAWLASIFMPIWFLFRGMWSIFFTYIILLFIAVAIDEAIYGHISSIDFNNASNGEWVWAGIQFIVFILPLFKGNDWTAKHLVKKGYLLVETVDAISKENAIAIVLENNTKSMYIENNPEIIDGNNEMQSEPSNKLNNINSSEKITPYEWVKITAGAVFIIMLLDGGDLITTIEVSLTILIGFSAFVWIYKKASGLSQSSFEGWYVLVMVISWVLIAIYTYLR